MNILAEIKEKRDEERKKRDEERKEREEERKKERDEAMKEKREEALEKELLTTQKIFTLYFEDKNRDYNSRRCECVTYERSGDCYCDVDLDC